MAKRKGPAFDSLWDAVVRGGPADVRALLDAGAGPDEREDVDDPTPLMYAAAVGAREVAELLIARGADVNAATEHYAIDLPEDAVPEDQPDDAFLDGVTSFNNTAWAGWTAPVYAALFGRREVYDFLRERASPAVRQQAEAVWAARQAAVNG